MNTDRLLIASVLCLAAGLSLIFGYCHGTAGFNAAYPLEGTSLQLSLVTTGLPALAGLILTKIGLVLLIWCAVDAIIREVSHASAPRHQVTVKN